MFSVSQVFLIGKSPLEQEQIAVRMLGEMVAACCGPDDNWSYRDARILANSITEAPPAFGLSDQFATVEHLAEPLGIYWLLSDSDPLLGFKVVRHA